MRTLSALLMVLLLCSVQQVYSGNQGANTPAECCYGFVRVEIPLKRIASYRWTSSNCPQKAIIFRTVIGKQWCANPEASWVKEHMKKLQS
ncbi:monocyte chemotactic protein 1B-like [Pygocentrus nattereri]|uniref:monocyte chemotactic protein 1B-like n=1 Tax=Pygocentrus nattereri TaxID=42514 RepID=UPI0008144C3E|nr:monocyte chemotactic protein 1B-like [Pygocentrus nattereri]